MAGCQKRSGHILDCRRRYHTCFTRLAAASPKHELREELFMISVFTKPFAGFLFDMDGTIINSAASTDRVWGRWAVRHGLDPHELLAKMHGSRSVDTIRRLNLPGVDPEREAAAIEAEEADDIEDVVAIPGAQTFLNSLPARRWALVTSSSKKLVLRRLEAAQLPVPEFLVTAEEVVHGKPDPEAYLLGAEKLGVNARDCLIFEDTMPGLNAGEAAGGNILLISAVHNPPLASKHEAVDDFRQLRAVPSNDGAVLRIEKITGSSIAGG